MAGQAAMAVIMPRTMSRALLEIQVIRPLEAFRPKTGSSYGGRDLGTVRLKFHSERESRRTKLLQSQCTRGEAERKTQQL